MIVQQKKKKGKPKKSKVTSLAVKKMMKRRRKGEACTGHLSLIVMVFVEQEKPTAPQLAKGSLEEFPFASISTSLLTH